MRCPSLWDSSAHCAAASSAESGCSAVNRRPKTLDEHPPVGQPGGHRAERAAQHLLNRAQAGPLEDHAAVGEHRAGQLERQAGDRGPHVVGDDDHRTRGLLRDHRLHQVGLLQQAVAVRPGLTDRPKPRKSIVTQERPVRRATTDRKS